MENEFLPSPDDFWHEGHAVIVTAGVWVDPSHRLESIKIILDSVKNHYFLEDFLDDLNSSTDDDLSEEHKNKLFLNEVFKYSDILVKYISTGEHVPFVSDIET